MISAVNKQYVYHLFIVALISIKFCMYADTNVTIPGAKFPKHWFKNRYKITKKKRFAYKSWTQCNAKLKFTMRAWHFSPKIETIT